MIGETQDTSVKELELHTACIDLAKIAAMIGNEAAFSSIQRVWPAISRKILDDMLAYSHKPNLKSLKKLMDEFAASMTCS